ncbi:hypothetical protein ACQJBY_005951 [Aegilops geniculata]
MQHYTMLFSFRHQHKQMLAATSKTSPWGYPSEIGKRKAKLNDQMQHYTMLFSFRHQHKQMLAATSKTSPWGYPSEPSYQAPEWDHHVIFITYIVL